MSHYSEELDAKFSAAKARAVAFAEAWNSKLPTDECPACRSCGHVPGLPCPECSHVYPVSWGIQVDTEWGYSVVAISNRRQILAEFNVES
jgi:hypothetical protein